MKELFIPFEIPNLEAIQAELLAAIDHDYTEAHEPHAFTFNEKYMREKCPRFMAWLKPKLKQPVRLYRYYVTPPNQSLRVHIDGDDPTVPFGLNIPILGCNNTLHTYYKTDPDNLDFGIHSGYLGGTHPKDLSKLEKIVDLEITRPYVINNEVPHGVVNNSDKHRIMFTIRWEVHPLKFRTVEEVIDTSDLTLGDSYSM